MAYVRKKGNQLAIVHGERDEAGAVQQRTLFTIYSKAEALAAVGDQTSLFRHILESDNPNIKFNWSTIERDIKADLGHLPDLVAYKPHRVEGQFREALVGFARELLLADPQTLISSARLLQGQRRELEYVKKLIDWRLSLTDQKENEWNRDNPFFWRATMARKGVPSDAWEELEELFNSGNHDGAEALAKLLVEAWDNFAIGHNYLGLVKMERRDFQGAVADFQKAMEVGRTLFPKRIKKADYWSDHETRPYIRSMCYLAQAYNRLGEYRKALDLCDRLERECGQDITGTTERIPLYLNSRQWDLAKRAASTVHGIYPEETFALAFATFELGDRKAAAAYMLHAVIRFPRAARMLCGEKRRTAPKGYEEVNDHNTGVGLLRDLETYLKEHRKAVGFLKEFMGRPEVVALVEEAKQVREKASANRTEDRTWYDRRAEMEGLPFAQAKAIELGL
jgi:tetratricopeptide (TPR) repeat protein